MTNKTDKTENVPIEIEDLNLWQRISAVRDECTAVAKAKTVGVGDYSYKVATHEDVNNMLKPLLVKYGLVDFLSLTEREIVDTTKRQGQKQLPVMNYRGRYEYTVINIDDASQSATIKVEGHGEDAGDKGPGKATTYAFKTGRAKMFSITTGEDEEGRISDDQLVIPTAEPITNEQFDILFQMIDEYWGDDAEKFLERFGSHILDATYGVKALIEVPRIHFEHCKKQIHNQAKREGKVEEEL